MKLPGDYQQAVREMSDEQLCEMLAHEADYLPNAIEVAKAELCRRESARGQEAQSQVGGGLGARAAATWEYRIEMLRGVKALPYGKSSQVKRVCDELGEAGWELVSVNQSWFLRISVLYFKRRRQTSVAG